LVMFKAISVFMTVNSVKECAVINSNILVCGFVGECIGCWTTSHFRILSRRYLCNKTKHL
jgi:hypothetical protein